MRRPAAHFGGLVLGWMLWGAISGGGAADWPTDRGDNARGGTSAETIRVPLKPRWIANARGETVSRWPIRTGVLVDRGTAKASAH